jgi:hypothetical protein
MLAVILLLVAVVVMSKIAELVPAGTVTVAGTLAFVGLLLIRVTTALLGVILLSVTVPTELEPPITDVGFKARAESAADVDAVTTTVANLFTPEYVAVMLLRVVALTVFVFTEKFVEDRFAGTITEAGTSAAESHSSNSRRLRSPAPGA